MAVLITAVGGAVAAIVGALSSRRSKREAEESNRQAAEQADKSLGLEERTVARAEFDSVVLGLREWATVLSTELGAARAELAALKAALAEKDGQILELRQDSMKCHTAKAEMEQRISELTQRIVALGGAA